MAGAAGMFEDWVDEDGAVLPGELPCAVTCASLAAPSGAGAVAPAPPDIAPCVSGVIAVEDGAMLPAEVAWLTAPAPPESALAEDAVLPGDAPGCVTTGAFGEAVGAGEGVAVCANAMPVDIKRAAEPSQNERMIGFLNQNLRLVLVGKWSGAPPLTRNFASPGY